MNINGLVFKIKDIIPKDAKSKTVDMGYSKVYLLEIGIDHSLPLTQQRSTLLHEMLETINTMCDLRLSHTTISTLETMLYSSLTTNKLLDLKQIDRLLVKGKG